MEDKEKKANHLSTVRAKLGRSIIEEKKLHLAQTS
jgi:hypothetical protein